MCPRLSAIYTLTLCLAYQVNGQWAVDDDGCRTPDRGVGTCVPIRNCQPIIQVLMDASRPLNAQITQLLASYQCGYDKAGAKVCCPPRPINIGGGNKGPSAAVPPDVSSHRNINLLPNNCGHLDTGDRIINGNKTGLFEFPWMALLSYNTARGPSFKCGGTIISDRYILTAAHCITNLKSPLLGVRVGDHDWSQENDCEVIEGVEVCAVPYQDVQIERVIPHPGYNSTALTSDIGLLRVAKMNISVESVRPVCLPLGDNRVYNWNNKKNVIVTGWGATNNDDGRSSPDLLKVQLPVIPHEDCKKRYKDVVVINDKQVCAGGKDKKDSCAGDSGGPLHVVGVLHSDARYIQQGIVSFGPKVCAIEGNPGVYTKVAFYMDWILDNLRP